MASARLGPAGHVSWPGSRRLIRPCELARDGRVGEQLASHGHAQLQHQPDTVRVAQQVRLGQRVTVDDGQVGELALGDGADVIVQPERAGSLERLVWITK